MSEFFASFPVGLAEERLGIAFVALTITYDNLQAFYLWILIKKHYSQNRKLNKQLLAKRAKNSVLANLVVDKRENNVPIKGAGMTTKVGEHQPFHKSSFIQI